MYRKFKQNRKYKDIKYKHLSILLFRLILIFQVFMKIHSNILWQISTCRVVHVCVHMNYIFTCIFIYIYLCISLCCTSMVHNWKLCFPSPTQLRISDSLSHINCRLYRRSHDLWAKSRKALSISCLLIRIYTRWSSDLSMSMNRPPIFKAVYSFIV